MGHCLLFRVKDLIGEVESLKIVAKDFLTTETTVRLDELIRKLRYARNPFAWEVETRRPLETEPSAGEMRRRTRRKVST